MKCLLPVLLMLLLQLFSLPALAGNAVTPLQQPEETLIAQEQKETALVCLVENPSTGCRFLRIAEADGAAVTSQPLPPDVSMDTCHSGPNTILLTFYDDASSTDGYISIRHAANGSWVCENVQLLNEHSLSLGRDHVTELVSPLIAPGRNDAKTYGIWKIPMPMGEPIQNADFSHLPMSCEEALRQLDPGPYAYVNNPNPADRLHLRAEAGKNAPSLGKFYNRTPVRVLVVYDEWSLVRIGSEEAGLTGYMMTKFLAFGEKKDGLRCAFPQLSPAESDDSAEKGPAIHTRPDASSDVKGYVQTGAENYIIGVAGEEWLIVMTPEGLVGYCRASDFDEGNG